MAQSNFGPAKIWKKLAQPKFGWANFGCWPSFGLFPNTNDFVPLPLLLQRYRVSTSATVTDRYGPFMTVTERYRPLLTVTESYRYLRYKCCQSYINFFIKL